MIRLDITNTRFGNLVAVRYSGDGKWECLCDCGAVRFVMTNRLRSGHTRSCGCGRRGLAFSNKPEYSSWQHMKRRCKADPGYAHVQICERWLNSFENFLEDMGKKPDPDASIDRIDNSKGYEPANCRWASKLVQTINRSWNKNNTSGARGVTWDSARKKWTAQISLGGRNKVKRFDSFEDAVAHRKYLESVYFEPIAA